MIVEHASAHQSKSVIDLQSSNTAPLLTAGRCRGIKRRGSDPCMLMAALNGSSDVCRTMATAEEVSAFRKRRSLDTSSTSSHASLAKFHTRRNRGRSGSSNVKGRNGNGSGGGSGGLATPATASVKTPATSSQQSLAPISTSWCEPRNIPAGTATTTETPLSAADSFNSKHFSNSPAGLPTPRDPARHSADKKSLPVMSARDQLCSSTSSSDQQLASAAIAEISDQSVAYEQSQLLSTLSMDSKRTSASSAPASLQVSSRPATNLAQRLVSAPKLTPVSSFAIDSQQSTKLSPIAPALTRTQVCCALPPINRYTLRELRIQNILQNPRLRHEVLFEPKLEFRPNSSGNMAETKLRTTQQYWAIVDQTLKKNNLAAVSTLTMLLVELREILVEMAEDSSKPELTHFATELREKLDKDLIRQQTLHGVFDPQPVVGYLATVMRQFAISSQTGPQEEVRNSTAAAVDRVVAYFQRGRVSRALRGAFDVLEAIKIDIANGSIEMYREYMRSTAVAFERSHFNTTLRRGSVSLTDTLEWWRRALDTMDTNGVSLGEMFAKAGQELILDDGQSVPGLFRMDGVRIQGIRRDLERLAIVGMVYLSFVQFLQLTSSAVAPKGSRTASLATGEFRNANGRLDYDRLAAECLSLVPEGCIVQWTESLTDAAASRTSVMSGNKANSGVVSLSHLVTGLLNLSERVHGRPITVQETELLERTLLRSARYECSLREVVEERVASAVRLHTTDLVSLNRQRGGSEWELMPQAAKDILRRSMLLFLAPSLSTLSLKISSVISHHWQVYGSLYSTFLRFGSEAGSSARSSPDISGIALASFQSTC